MVERAPRPAPELASTRSWAQGRGVRTLRIMERKVSSAAPPVEMTEEQIDGALGQIALQRRAEDDGTRIPLEEVLAEFTPELLP